MPLKVSGHRIKALATYAKLAAKARAVVGGAKLSEQTMTVLARAAVFSVVAKTENLSIAVKASLLKATAATGHFFTLYEIFDSFVTSERTTFDISKLREDEIRLVEEALIALTKSLRDDATTKELTTFFVGKDLLDPVRTTAELVQLFGKQLNDPAVTVTATDKDFATAKDDPATTSDTATSEVGKELGDYATTADAFSRAVAFVRFFDDSVDATDEINAAVLTDDGEVFFLDKRILDSATTDTQLSYDIARVSADTAQLLDQPDLLTEKVLADAFSTATTVTALFEKTAADTASTSDVVSYEGTKAIDDAAVSSDVSTKAFVKPLDDFSVAADTSTVFTAKNKADVVSSSDTTTSVLGKTLTDSAALSDLKLFDLSRVSADSAAVADSLAHTFNKQVADSVSATDTLYLYFALVKVDSAATTDIIDVIRIAANGVPPQLENQYATDQASWGLQKTFAEVLTATDDFDGTLTTEDDQTTKLDKRFSESVSLLEVQKFDLQRTLSETQSATDTGYLFLTDYCDISYFSEPFVGQERIFT